ncbi:unnamed protein product [Rotaria sp. Silwood1]|nr:unnamed protein product [Rotaria sp. Silwood1]CAF3497491.1 unnamed protein product [Rotaria sp. Silwood1]CAF3547500.1 unnamed protein product [Rotaria sp. Silwood1]CAF4642139.1 unnamed protein product [Rotaria sp. Silwood1]CAF4886047.1 unnamed protein product [Rotaria sp. Silwood1]
MTYQYFNRLQSITNEYSSTTSLLLAVIKCQILLPGTCSLYLKWYPPIHQSELFLQIPHILLSPFTQWIISCHSDSIIHCSKDVRNILRRLNNAFVRLIQWENVNISNQEFYNDYCRLVSKWSSFL